MTRHSFLIFCAFALTLLFASCSGSGDPDAYGIVDARKWTVSFPEDGQVASLSVEEGDHLVKDAVVGQLDTGRLALERQAALDQIRALRPTLPNVGKQMDVLGRQKEALEKERERIAPLVESGTASRQQLDEIDDRLRVTDSHIEATRSSLSRESAAVLAQIEALRSRVRILDDRIRRCTLTNPEDGTVTSCLVRSHEYVQAGHPVYVLSDLRRLFVNAWLEEDKVSGLAVGDAVRIRVDLAGERKTLDGTVRFIAEEAEFTPVRILTRDARSTLVYHVKIDLPETEGLRSGMPAEVFLSLGK